VAERIDIIITDQVSTAPTRKLKDMAAAALKADAALDRVQGSLNSLGVGSLDKLATASAKLTTAQARQTAASARLVTARSREATANATAAVSAQRLATEQQRTAIATENATNAAARARTALVNEEAASLRLAAAKDRQASATQRAAVAQNILTRNSRAVRGAIQQTSFQLQDIIVQMQMGTRTSVVLGQQLPQMAGAFGAVGAAIGVVLAIGIPLISYLLPGILDGSEDASKATEELADAVYDLREASRLARQPLVELAEEYGGNASEVQNFVDALERLRQQQALNALQTALTAIEQDEFSQSILRTVRGIDNVNQIYQQNARGILLTLGLTEDQLVAVSDAYRQYLEAGDDQERLAAAAENFRETLDRVGLSGEANFNRITAGLSAAGQEFNNLNRIIEVQLGELDLTEANARRVLAAYQDLRDAKTFEEAARESQEFRVLLEQLGIEVDQGLIPTLIDFEGTARQAFANGGNAALAMRDDVRSVTAEIRNAIAALDQLRSAGINDLRVAEINLEFRTDPVGRARALAEERARAEQEVLRDGAGPGEIAYLEQQVRLIGDAAAETERLNQERIRLNAADREAEARASRGGSGGSVASRAREARQEAEAYQELVRDLRQLDQELVGTSFAYEAELDEVRAREQERLDIVQEALNNRIIAEEEAAARVVEINRAAAEEIRQIEVTRNTDILQAAGATFDSLAQMAAGLAGEQSAAYKALFIVSKGFAIAESIIKIQQAAAAVLADPTALTPAQKIANYAIIAAQGASIVASLQAVQFADGGRVSGPGGPRDDKILARLSNGEFVVNARATAQYLPLLQAINDNREPTRAVPQFADGGAVRPFRAPSQPAKIGNTTVNNENRFVVQVKSNDPNTKVRISETQAGARQARMVQRGQRNL